MKIGLALSGGGAVGAAHIGILEALEQNNIKIDYISGTSAGAIIALLYAEGGISLVNNFFDDLANKGLYKRSTILLKRNETIFSMVESILRHRIKSRSFSELKIPFCCVATDILKGRPVILGSGDPVEAVMASAAYPGVFSPRKIDNRFCVDGALTTNLPARILRNKGADFIIGSSLYAIPELETVTESNLKLNLLNTAIRSIDIMSKIIADYEIEHCDFCFEPPVETYAWYRFDKAYEIKNLGYKYGFKEMEKLKKAIKTHSKQKKNSIWQFLFGK